MRPFSTCMFSPEREAPLDMDQCGNSGCTRVFRLDGSDDPAEFAQDDHGTSPAGFASLHHTIWNTEFIHFNIQKKKKQTFQKPKWKSIQHQRSRMSKHKKKLKGKNSIFKKFRCTYWTPFTGRPGGTRIRIAMNCVLWPFGRNASVRVLEEFVVANNLSPFVSGAAGFRALRTSIKPSSVLMR